ncbi:hypothetical protein BDV11DRAFT_210013 [Aspergillus similis]
MIGMWSEQGGSILQNLISKKRKKDTIEVGAFQHPINCTSRIISSHSHNFDAPIHFRYTSPLKQDNECTPGQQYLSRKRRAPQQPGFYSPPSLQSLPCPPADLKVSSASEFSVMQEPSASQQNSYPSPSFLRPCHICHRRPTTRELLQAYADCDLCGERACFICLRRCDECWDRGNREEQQLWGATANGLPPDKCWNALQDKLFRKVCSCCAVEGVTDTGMEVVRCLACIR